MADRIDIRGVGWSGTVDIVAASGGVGDVARRVVSASMAEGEVSGDLMIVHASALDITVEAIGGPYRWRGSDEGTPPHVLAVATTDAGFRCVGGEISLGSMEPRRRTQRTAPADRALYETTGLSMPETGPEVSVHAGGVSITGATSLPWDPPDLTVSAGFLLVSTPDGAVLTPETHLMSDADREVWRNAWTRFAAQINPGNPRVGGSVDGPDWLTLEVIDPAAIPSMSWRLTSGEETEFRLAPGTLRVLVSEGPVYGRSGAGSILVLRPDEVHIRRAGPSLTVDVVGGAAPGAPAAEDRLQIMAARSADGWGERASLAADRLAPDPIHLASDLRKERGVAAPRSPASAAEADALWLSMPLEDGWLQVPTPNLTEQLMLDAGLGPVDAGVASTVASGAVIFGNTGERGLGEHVWTLAVGGAQSFHGRWAVDDGRLDGAALTLVEPAITLDGILWRAVEGSARASDLLPDQSDWVAGLRSEPMYGGAAAGRRRRSVLGFGTKLAFEHVGQGSARLGESETGSRPSLTCRLDEDALAELASARPALVGGDHATIQTPVIWLRHPVLPMIQALPMTQTARPANTPSASRGLFPFAPLADGPWSLELAIGGADRWPTVSMEHLRPAPAWTALTDLPAVSLSAPGLAMDPAADGSATAVFRYDIPLLDERAALSAADGPTPSSADVSSPRGYADYWGELATRAALARVDQSTAFEVDAPDGLLGASALGPTAAPIRDLIDADDVDAVVTTDLSAFPPRVEVRIDDDVQEAVGDAVLAVPSVTFPSDHDRHPGAEVDAGSVAMRSNGMFRDQTGVGRDGTRVSAQLLTTPVDVGSTSDSHLLVTTLQPVELLLPGASDPWVVWLRDVPFEVGGDGHRFGRASTPRALMGYEWRLGGPTRIMALDFFPLELQAATMVGGEIAGVTFVGRVQLPTADGPIEIDALTNAVEVTFDLVDGRLELANVRLAGGVAGGAWPLQLIDGEIGGAPMLVWDSIELTDGGTLRIGDGDGSGPRLEFFAFDRRWTTQLDGALEFPDHPPVAQLIDRPDAVDERASRAHPSSVELSLDGAGRHSAQLLVDFEAGGEVDVRVAIDLMRPDLRATVRQLTLFGMPFDNAAGTEVPVTSESLQVSWDGMPTDETSVHVLPGYPLVAPGLPGYAAFTFATTPTESGIPGFTVTDALAEVVMHGSAPPGEPGDHRLCSGELVVGYLARLDRAGLWHRSVEVNGWIEVLGHQAMPRVREDDETIALPTLDEPGPLILHRARILLNSHILPIGDGQTPGLIIDADGTPRPADEPRSLWTIGGPLEIWAVVEHGLSVDGDADRRITTTQPVTFLSAAQLADELVARSVATTELVHPGGLLHPDALAVVEPFLRARPDLTMVTADLALWIDRTPLTGGTPTAIRRLPLGVQSAIVADPMDYVRRDADWMFTELPFIATLAKSTGDEPFRTHPVGLMDAASDDVRAFAALMTGHIPAGAASETQIGSIDGTDGRRVPRIDAMELASQLTEDRDRQGSGRLLDAPDLESVVSVRAEGAEARGAGARFAAVLPAPSDSWLVNAVSSGPAAGDPPQDATSMFRLVGDAARHNLGSSTAKLNLATEGWSWADSGLEATDDGFTAHVQLPNKRADQRPLSSFTLVAEFTSDHSGRAITIAEERPGRAREVVTLDVQRAGDQLDMSLHVGGQTYEASAAAGLGTTTVVFTSESRSVQGTPARFGRLFVDGHLIAEGTHRPFQWRRGRDRTATRLRLGAPDPVRSMTGIHHMVGLFDRPLTAAEAAAFSSSGAPGVIESMLPAAVRISSLFDVDASATDSGTVLHPGIAVVPNGDDATMVVGPYLALDLRRADHTQVLPEAESVELVAFGRDRSADRRLRPIASQLVDGVAAPSDLDLWARSLLERSAYGSTLAVLRRRQVVTNADRAVLVSYGFQTVDPPRRVTRLGWQGHRLRHEPEHLRFPDAQFGGTHLPDVPDVGRMAPPLVTGAQPIRRADLGWSGLRVTTRHADVDGPTPSGLGTRWADARWHALQQQVRFREEVAAAPSHFAAGPRHAVSAVAGAPRLPMTRPAGSDDPSDDVANTAPTETIDTASNGDAVTSNHRAPWRPVMPDAIRHLLAGNRPGALLEMRSHVLHADPDHPDATETTAVALPSGSVPVTMRVPRPLPLPPAHRIVSGVADGQPVRVASEPVDFARFDFEGGTFAIYQMDLLGATPLPGVDATDWFTRDPIRLSTIDVDAAVDTLAGFRFAVNAEADEPRFAANPEDGRRLDMALIPEAPVLTDGTRRLPLRFVQSQSSVRLGTFQVVDLVAVDGSIVDFVRAVQPGGELWIEAMYPAPSPGQPARQLRHTLRVASARHIPLVHRRKTIRFEDPGYNAALATQVRAATGTLPSGTDEVEVVVRADRSVYGPGSPIVFATATADLSLDPAPPLPPLALDRVTQEEEVLPLDSVPAPVTSDRNFELWLSSIGELAAANGIEWNDGDRLRMTLGSREAPVAVMELSIVSHDPNPAPTSAYALLRTEDTAAVECRRYAVGPLPSRIELLDVNDLFDGVVRRRAIFEWTDTVRSNRFDTSYYVQKVTSGGSTHVPELGEFVGDTQLA